MAARFNDYDDFERFMYKLDQAMPVGRPDLIVIDDMNYIDFFHKSATEYGKDVIMWNGTTKIVSNYQHQLEKGIKAHTNEGSGNEQSST